MPEKKGKEKVIVLVDASVIARFRAVVQKKHGKLWGLQSHEIGLAIQDRIEKLEGELEEGC